MSEPFTIRDVVAQVNEPEDYVRGVLRNLFEMRDVGEWVEVHFAATKGNAPPDYSVYAVMDSDPITGGGTTLQAFSGKTHRPLSDGKDVLKWSGVTATHSEVSALIGELRNYQPKKVKPAAHRT
jgi:hypothetical protein